MSRVTVLGGGSWGTALAILLAQNGHTVVLWARDEMLVEHLMHERENHHYLPGFPLPSNVNPTSSMSQACRQAQMLVIAVPCHAVREVMELASPMLPPSTILLSAAKGLEAGTGLRMTELLREVAPAWSAHTAALSGPNLAVELARGAPTAGVVAAQSLDTATAVQQLFSIQPTLRLYTSTDTVGVELGGAIKNVIAIGAGICDGLGLGDNAKAALMTRGLAEAVRLGVAKGAHANTFLGLSGVGDLVATAASNLSRNHRVGYALGVGKTLPAALDEIGQIAEGVPTTRVICKLASDADVEIPLCCGIESVLFENAPPHQVLESLMQRPLKTEV